MHLSHHINESKAGAARIVELLDIPALTEPWCARAATRRRVWLSRDTPQQRVPATGKAHTPLTVYNRLPSHRAARWVLATLLVERSQARVRASVVGYWPYLNASG